MRYAIDLDGVVYEWQRTVRYMLNHYRDTKLPPVSEFWHTWNAPKELISKQDWRWLWSQGVKLGLFRYGHMTKGARIGLQELDRMGHDLLIATSRPVVAVNDTLEWVSLYFRDIPLVGIHILSDGEDKRDVDADVLVDDRLENALSWGEGGQVYKRALLFDRPWNQVNDHRETHDLPRKSVVRVKGWEGVVEWATTHQNKT